MARHGRYFKDGCHDCHSECAGGCSGPSNRDCRRCAHASFRSHCLPECPAGVQCDECTDDAGCENAARWLL